MNKTIFYRLINDGMTLFVMTSFAKETYEQDWNFEYFSGIYQFTAALLPTDTLLQREGTRKQTQDSTGKEIGFI